MSSCPMCGKEIVYGASVCKHCRAVIGTPKRPLGVTVIAIIALVSSVSGLFYIFDVDKTNSIILGIHVPVIVMWFHSLILDALGIYCGVGFLKQKAIARKIYIWVTIYGLVHWLISGPIIVISMRPSDIAKGFYVVITITMLGVNGWILYYLIRRKDYFTN